MNPQIIQEVRVKKLDGKNDDQIRAELKDIWPGETIEQALAALQYMRPAHVEPGGLHVNSNANEQQTPYDTVTALTRIQAIIARRKNAALTGVILSACLTIGLSYIAWITKLWALPLSALPFLVTFIWLTHVNARHTKNLSVSYRAFNKRIYLNFGKLYMLNNSVDSVFSLGKILNPLHGLTSRVSKTSLVVDILGNTVENKLMRNSVSSAEFIEWYFQQSTMLGDSSVSPPTPQTSF